MNELAGEVQRAGLVATISGSTIWRWLDADAIRPWTHRSWIFPRAPDFATKAGRILDLYDRVWEGQPLTTDDYVISADEKTSIQARRRYPNLVLIHGPVHASWLNQIEIYFSIVQRKVVTPNDFTSLAVVEDRLLAFQRHYEALVRPFEWTYTRRDLAEFLEKLDRHSRRQEEAA